MAATTTELMVRLVADTKGFAAELGGATRDIDTLQAKAVRMGTAMQDVGRRMTLGFTVPFVAGMGLAVKAASDLEESQNKVDVVFGKNAATIKRWAADSATSFGLSRAAAYEAAGTFGNLFRSMDIALPSATKMSKGIVQLAADLASFNNANPEEVLVALRAGLVGEVEPLRKFGVSLSAARVEAKALEMGLWDGIGSIDAAAKAQAAYAIILDDTTLAQGDFARTSDGAANQMRIARAQLTDASAEIGSVVLPIFADLVGVLADVAQWFANLPGPVKTAIVVLGGLVAAAGPVLWVTGSMIKNVSALTQAFPNLTSAVGSFAGPAGIAAAAVGTTMGLMYALGFFGEITSGVSVNVDSLTNKQRALQSQLVGLRGEISNVNAEWARQKARADEMGVTFSPGSALSSNMAAVRAKFADLKDDLKKLAQESPELARQFIKQAEAAGFSEKQIAALERIVNDSESAMVAASIAADKDAANLARLKGEAGGTAQSIDDLRKAFDDLTNAQFDVEGSAISMEKAIQNLDDAVRNGKDGTLEGRQAFLDAKRSIDDWGQAVYDNAVAAGKSTADASAEQQWALGQVAGSLAPDSPLRQWLSQYIWDLGAIPRTIDTVLRIRGVADELANRVLSSAGAWISGMDGRAAGGPVANGVPYLVGENGPEIFVPNGSGTIIPNHVAMGGGGPIASAVAGGSYTFHIYDATDPEKVMAAISRAVANGALPDTRTRSAFAN